MSNRNYSFSVPPKDVEAAKVIIAVKQYCKRTGRSFSFIVVKALAKYLKELPSEQV